LYDRRIGRCRKCGFLVRVVMRSECS
jgi:hypothetical protein